VPADVTFVGALLMAIGAMAGAVAVMFKIIVSDKDKQIERERGDQATIIADKERQIERLHTKVEELTKTLGDLAGPMAKLLEIVQEEWRRRGSGPGQGPGPRPGQGQTGGRGRA
jgi:hypothetical protein